MIHRTFDAIGRGITSLAPVIFIMLLSINGNMLISHTQFYRIFPTAMEQWERDTATWLMAFTLDCTILITTCNTRYVNKNVPVVLAICSSINVLFFMEAFDTTQPVLIIVQRWFFASMAGYIQYIYAELFYEKWQERNSFVELPAKVQQLEAALQQSIATVQQLEATVQQTQSKLHEADRELHQLRLYKKESESMLTCPYCNTKQATPDTLRTHKGHCKQNPKKKQ